MNFSAFGFHESIFTNCSSIHAGIHHAAHMARYSMIQFSLINNLEISKIQCMHPLNILPYMVLNASKKLK